MKIKTLKEITDIVKENIRREGDIIYSPVIPLYVSSHISDEGSG